MTTTQGARAHTPAQTKMQHNKRTDVSGESWYNNSVCSELAFMLACCTWNCVFSAA